MSEQEDPMQYVPLMLQGQDYDDVEFSGWHDPPRRLAIVRRVPLTSYYLHADGTLDLYLGGSAAPLRFPATFSMVFGTETIAAGAYAWMALEEGDLVDLVYNPEAQCVECFWIHIEYPAESNVIARRSFKDDGLFALRTKSGEKAERMVATDLARRFGHQYPQEVLQGSGTFQIRYLEKGLRRPDLRCSHCGLLVEVKRRNRDRRYRISHSVVRPFETENDFRDWHAFVFPDMSIHYVSNRTILWLIERGCFSQGQDQYDGWADLPADTEESHPPTCTYTTEAT